MSGGYGNGYMAAVFTIQLNEHPRYLCMVCVRVVQAAEEGALCNN